MEKTKTKYGIVEAAFAIEKHRNTITRHIKSGKLSCEIDENKTKWIDAAELHRVYGDAFNPNRKEGSRDKSNTISVDGDAVQVQALLDREIAERDRERNQYLAQIENLKDSLATAQEGHNRATLLLENQSVRGGDWEQALKTMKEELANEREMDHQKLEGFKETAKRNENRLRRALEEERNKTFWQKLFG